MLQDDPRFGHVLSRAGRPPLRRRADGFAGLVIDRGLAAALDRQRRSDLGRLTAAFDPLDPAAVLRARPAKLARTGLSAPKIRTLKAIAKAVDRGELDLAALAAMSADDAHAALTAVHGIGPWTADIYLLFCLGHADAWPAGDLALQEAAQTAARTDDAADRQGNGAARRSMAAMARGRGAACCGRTIARANNVTACW